jgi:hypothetical protein
VLAIPHPASRHCRHAEDGAAAAKIGPLSNLERHPATDKLLDLHRHAKEMLKDRPQPFGIARMPNQCADVEELREVGNRIPRAK